MIKWLRILIKRLARYIIIIKLVIKIKQKRDYIKSIITLVLNYILKNLERMTLVLEIKRRD